MKRISGILATMLLASVVQAADLYVVVPDITWSELLPYLEANLRVDRDAEGVIVGASSMPYETKLFEPYDEALGEFATVLLVEGIRERKILKAVNRVTQKIEADGFDASDATPRELAAAYWTRLKADARFTRHLQELLAKAQDDRRLACFICGEGFEPQHLKVQ